MVSVLPHISPAARPPLARRSPDPTLHGPDLLVRFLPLNATLPNLVIRRVRDRFRPQRRSAEVASAGVAPGPIEAAGDVEIVTRCAPFTMTSPERIHAVLVAVAYCTRRGVPGDFAECGVWRGGSVLAMILKLQELDVDDRTIHLYDTFEGMTEPSERDTSAYDPPALETWIEQRASGEIAWDDYFRPDVFNEDDVRSVLLSTGYAADRLRFVKGPVEATLPAEAPDQLALLRLDTDWYESTMHELQHLYPRLAVGGVLIIDDYGHWDGCRQAVDEYFSRTAAPLLLNRIDYTGRIAVKV
ncbi:MAG: putative methyltransferase [Actinomycetia bacterium]|nr:putative methyltransferase [Actinomycetes bacterium]